MYSIRLFRFVFIVTVVCVQINSNFSLIVRDGLEDSRYMSTWRVQCRRLGPLKNGLMRIRNSGRTVRYQCKSGYTLLGEKRLVCRGYTWDKSPPQCIRPGCSLQQPTNGHVEQLYQGALAKFACYSGYLLSGPSVISCDGYSWNASIPACWRNEEETSIGSCDLEKGLCGWVNSARDEFDWKLNILNTPSGLIGTGPSFDHTFGYGRKGHYLYLESSSPQSVNDTAVLTSPFFPAVVTNNETRCFTFWYHMYGAGIGKLNVYVNNTLNFTESGNHGNRWIRGVIPLEGDDIFMIKIEGVRGPSYAGDIAIDDFAIAEGSACEETSPLLGSCSGRCFTDTVSDDNACYCMESCQTNSTCCSDFYTLCTIDYGMSTAQAGLASSSSLESKSIDTSTESFISTTTAQLIVNSIDYSSTTVSSSPITTSNTNNSLTTEQNYKNINDNHKNPVTVSRNSEQPNSTLNNNFTVTTQQTTLITTSRIPNMTGNNNSTQKIVNNDSKPVTEDSKTIETTKTSSVNNTLSVETLISSNVTIKQNTTLQLGNNTTQLYGIQTTRTPNSTQFTPKSDLNQENISKFDSDYVVLKRMVERLGKSPRKDHIDSVIEEFLKGLKNQEYEKILGNNFTTKNQSPTYTTREAVTKNPLQLNTTTVSLFQNVTLKNLARTTKIPFNLTITTKLNNITTTTTANRVTSTTKLNNITTASANQVTPTTKLNSTTTTTAPSNRVTSTPKYPKIPGIRFKVPPKTWKSNTYFNPRLRNDVFSKNLTKAPTANPIDGGFTQFKMNVTQKMNISTTKNISRPTTIIKTFVRTTTQATHMSVIKTKVDVGGKSMSPFKNGKWKKFSDKESHAPYVISQQTDSKKASIAIISVISFLAIVCSVIAVFTCRKRISRDRRGLDDDSDVQYLTSDELINFNLARPSPERQANSETCR